VGYAATADAAPAAAALKDAVKLVAPAAAMTIARQRLMGLIVIANPPVAPLRRNS
jgi:hypothetical protein